MKLRLQNELEWCVRHYDHILFEPHPEVKRETIGDHRLLQTPIAHPLFNCVFTLDEGVELSSAEGSRIVAQMSAKPFSWWVYQDNEKVVGPELRRLGLEAKILAVALRHSGDIAPCQLPDGFCFDEVGEGASPEDLVDVLTSAYGTSPEAIRFKLKTSLLSPRRLQKAIVVRELETGLPVAAGTVAKFPGKPDIACLTGAVTREAFRRRGLYRALTRMRLSLAADLGAEITFILGDETSSVPICQGLGFVPALKRIVLYLPRSSG